MSNICSLAHGDDNLNNHFPESRCSKDIGHLPVEILIYIVRLLEPRDIFRCRYVCQRWYRAFSTPEILKDSLVLNYPSTREVRSLLAIGAPSHTRVWKSTFDNVYARYCALESGAFYSERTIHLYGTIEPFRPQGLDSGQYPVSHWERSLDDDIGHPFWSFDAGLLVYLDAHRQSYVVLDLDTDSVAIVPFGRDKRVVRRLRLSDGVLLFEWAQAESYHKLNPTEDVHRHFVTAYDVTPNIGTAAGQPRYTVSFRSEWKLHFLGFPLKSKDVWISAHTQQHYAVYIWQYNRSAWGEDEPIESLLVWDISEHSTYTPSTDPSGSHQPTRGPQVVNVLPYKRLDHLGIRQRDTPMIRGLVLDNTMVYVVELRYLWERGHHIGPHPLDEDLHDDWVRSTAVPIVGIGPPLVTINKATWQQDKWIPAWKNCGLICDATFSGHGFQDDVTGIRFELIESNEGAKYLLISHKHWESFITIHDKNVQSNIGFKGDERRVVIQERDVLRILHFDPGTHGPGNRLNKKARSDRAGLGNWQNRDK